MELNIAVRQVGDWAKRKGWTFDAKDTPEKIALMHSELSEALEEYRKGKSPRDLYRSFDEQDISKPEGIAVEMMDCVIRIFHYFDNHGINAEQVFREKMDYNELRPHRHGKVI